MELSPLHERIHAAVGGRTYRAIAELTASNAETVRRYMMGQAPSAEFLAALCQAIGLNAQWLLTGRGPMKASHIKAHALSEASAAELLQAMARTLERLTDRVERLEVFVTTLEAKLRGVHTLLANDDRRRMIHEGVGAPNESGPSSFPSHHPHLAAPTHAPNSPVPGPFSAGPAGGRGNDDDVGERGDRGSGRSGGPPTQGNGPNPGDHIRVRADSIADALAPRPRPDAR